jgi:predicted dehydrogenase/threonine dehydrogenase-like Zn-dependent dehydrogenase
VLVRNVCSLVSVGTEKAALEFGQANPIEKARKRPDLVRRVVQKAASDGIWQTYQTVRQRLDQPLALGYSSAGIVVSSSAPVAGLRTGDRVACAGFGFASHAEYVSVPVNLVTSIPPNVPFEQACFVTVGAIGMQAIRLAQLELGETVIVYGLGLVGMVTGLLARANGCQVLGVDIDATKIEFARSLGLDAGCADESLGRWIAQRTGGHGADKLLLCAATPSSAPMQTAPTLLRQKGVVVVVGDVGMEIPRRPYYDREIDIRIARSYGPGRYDPSYEEGGLDYPYAYVRWTENRNMAAVLTLLGNQQVDFGPLVTHRFGIDEARSAYQQIESPGARRCLGVVLRYCSDHADAEMGAATIKLPYRRRTPAEGRVEIGVIGAGNFARSVLLPAFAKTKQVHLRGIHTATGISALIAARRHRMDFATADPDAILRDPKIRAVVIASRHDSHAEYVLRALQQEKAVFVEKPLAIREEDLDAITDTYQTLEESGRRPFLMVGYNRRFSPLIASIREHFSRPGSPLSMLYRVNAGELPPGDWTLDREVGGGRLLGECCHFLDLMAYLCQSAPAQVAAFPSPGGQGAMIHVQFADGSAGTLHYITEGHRKLGKEYLEVHGDGLSVVLDNFRCVRAYGKWSRGRKRYLTPQKGHAQEAAAVTDAILRDGPAPIPFADLVATSRATFRALESLQTGQLLPVEVDIKSRATSDHVATPAAVSRRCDESDRRDIAC